MFSPRFDELVQSLKILPGVGPKSAQRMALFLLTRQPGRARKLAQALENAVEHISTCGQCRSLAEQPICDICMSPARDDGLLCVVESPADIMAIEQSGSYRGRYFVLGGHLSPLDGVGPQEIGIPLLVDRLGACQISELILATSATVEGQTTAHYIQEICGHLVGCVTRIAQGVPQGGELEYVDSQTLMQAFRYRQQLG